MIKISKKAKNMGSDKFMRLIGIGLIIIFFSYIFLYNWITGGNMINTVIGIMTLSVMSSFFLS